MIFGCTISRIPDPADGSLSTAAAPRSGRRTEPLSHSLRTCFGRNGNRPASIRKAADGRGAEERLLDLTQFHRTVAWSAQGLVFELTTDDGAFWIELFAGGARRRLVEGFNARLSPDERWLAYSSDTSGRDEVHVTAFPEGGARWQIAEGNDPIWSPHTAELLYVRDDRLMAAKLDTSAGVRVVSQRVVQISFATPVFGDYDLSPDGSTLAVIRSTDPLQGREVVVAFDWLAELGRAPLA